MAYFYDCNWCNRSMDVINKTRFYWKDFRFSDFVCNEMASTDQIAILLVYLFIFRYESVFARHRSSSGYRLAPPVVTSTSLPAFCGTTRSRLLTWWNLWRELFSFFSLLKGSLLFAGLSNYCSWVFCIHSLFVRIVLSLDNYLFALWFFLIVSDR